MNMDDPAHPKIFMKVKESKTTWDFLSSLYPPEDLAIEKG
jgi:hypothetical protein